MHLIIFEARMLIRSLVLAALCVLCAAQSSDWVSEVTTAVQSLNVPSPSSWSSLMSAPSVSGKAGRVSVSGQNYESMIASLGISDADMLNGVESAARMLVLTAQYGGVGEYVARSVVLDSNAHTGELITVLMLGMRQPDNTVAITYMLSTATSSLTQQYSTQNQRSCHRCAKCIWFGRCCCHDETVQVPRGNTVDEIAVITQEMKAAQYSWINQQIQSGDFNNLVGKQ